MTLLSQLLSVFPAVVMMMTLIAAGYFVYHPGLWEAIAPFLLLYGLPPLVYRIHAWRYPVTKGIYYLGDRTYSPWWGSHQIQLLYIAFPALETVLRLIPGVFSAWLRIWGASIGQDVYWTPALEIADRELLTVGDRAVFGHHVGLYAHAIKPKNENLMLYVKPITIGSHTFIGAGTRIGPGVVIDDGSYVPAKTDLYPHQRVQQQALETNQSTTA